MNYFTQVLTIATALAGAETKIVSWHEQVL